MAFWEWYGRSSWLIFTIGLLYCQSALFLILLIHSVRVPDWANMLLQLMLKEVFSPETKCEYLFQSLVVKSVQFRTWPDTHFVLFFWQVQGRQHTLNFWKCWFRQSNVKVLTVQVVMYRTYCSEGTCSIMLTTASDLARTFRDRKGTVWWCQVLFVLRCI